LLIFFAVFFDEKIPLTAFEVPSHLPHATFVIGAIFVACDHLDRISRAKLGRRPFHSALSNNYALGPQRTSTMVP
jgi:hypothetical protein